MSVSRTIETLVAATFRLVPQRRRFAVAMRLSAPIAACLDALVQRPRRLTSAREYTLGFILGALDANRVLYDLPQAAESVQRLGETAARTGALLVSTHANAGLSRLILSQTDSAGIRLTVISAAAGFPIAGSGRSSPTITPEGTFLVNVRNRWKHGEVIASMVDTTPRSGDRSVPERGSFAIADPIVRLAARCGVPVFSITARIGEERVIIDLTELHSHPDEDELVAELARSLSGELAATR